VALQWLSFAVSCAAYTGAAFGVRALRDVRKPRLAADFTGESNRRILGGVADPEAASFAMRALPKQVFFAAAAAK